MRIGDSVRIGEGEVATSLATSLRIAGIATFPTIGIVHGARTSLGVGGLVVPDRVPGFDRQLSGNGQPGSEAGDSGPPVVFVRYTSGANRGQAHALVTEVAATTSEFPGSAVVLGPQRPAEIVNSSDVGGVPALLATLLGAATAISLGIALAASVDRRRSEFALLRSLGFTTRQLTTSVMWQATATVFVGLLIGIPLGIAVGHKLWVAVAPPGSMSCPNHRSRSSGWS